MRSALDSRATRPSDVRQSIRDVEMLRALAAAENEGWPLPTHQTENTHWAQEANITPTRGG